jgi:hypothetical protein
MAITELRAGSGNATGRRNPWGLNDAIKGLGHDDRDCPILDHECPRPRFDHGLYFSTCLLR